MHPAHLLLDLVTRIVFDKEYSETFYLFIRLYIYLFMYVFIYLYTVKLKDRKRSLSGKTTTTRCGIRETATTRNAALEKKPQR